MVTTLLIVLGSTLTVTVTGGYVLAWRIMSLEREDYLRIKAEEKEKIPQCPIIRSFNYNHGKRNAHKVTYRCELKEKHHGPHTAVERGYQRVYWEQEK